MNQKIKILIGIYKSIPDKHLTEEGKTYREALMKVEELSKEEEKEEINEEFKSSIEEPKPVSRTKKSKTAHPINS